MFKILTYKQFESQQEEFYWKEIPKPDVYPSTNHSNNWIETHMTDILGEDGNGNDVKFGYKDWDFKTQDYEVDEIEKKIIDLYQSDGKIYLVADDYKTYEMITDIEVKVKGKRLFTNEDPYGEEVWESYSGEDSSIICFDDIINKHDNKEDCMRELEDVLMDKTILLLEWDPDDKEWYETPDIGVVHVNNIRWFRKPHWDNIQLRWVDGDEVTWDNIQKGSMNVFVLNNYVNIGKGEAAKFVTLTTSEEDPYGEEVWEAYHKSQGKLTNKYIRFTYDEKDQRGRLVIKKNVAYKILYFNGVDYIIEGENGRRFEVDPFYQEGEDFFVVTQEELDNRRRIWVEKHPEDPYGEEIWESYKVGDKVYFEPRFTMLNKYKGFNEITDTLEDADGEIWYQLNKLNHVKHKISFMNPIRWVNGDDLFDTKEEAELDVKKRQEEIDNFKREKEEKRRRKYDMMKDVDPYGEEEWEKESLVNEIFDTEKTYPYQFVTKRSWMKPFVDHVYKFTSRDNITYYVTLSLNTDWGRASIKFTDKDNYKGIMNKIKDKYVNLELHDAINVLNTVFKIGKDYYEKFKDQIKEVTTNTLDEKRLSIYKYLFGKYFKGWKMNSYTDNRGEFVLEFKPPVNKNI